MSHTGATLSQARAAKTKAAAVFRKLVGDVAIGIESLGDGRYGLKINLASAPDSQAALPAEVDNVPVHVEVVGKIRKR